MQPDSERRIHPRRAAAWAFACLGILAACVYVPRDPERHASYSAPPDAATRIADLIGPAPEGRDRALLIDDPREALVLRLDMIDRADHALDAQYFIWQNDATGILTIEHLLAAADRGVHVRALVDDIQLQGLVGRLNVLNDHPNVEIRIFNPFSVNLRYQLGLFRLAEFAIDGNRLNHRMHNKLMVADNEVAILGGRNIGDDYFAESPERNFVDTDVLLAGPVVQALSGGFDRYWNSRWAYPVEAMLNLTPTFMDLDALRRRIHERLAGQAVVEMVAQARTAPSPLQRLADAPGLDGAETLIDDPAVSWFDRPDQIARELTGTALSARRRVLVVSPYLVLTPGLLEVADELTANGVEIRVLTNSLASNDVVVAHAAYARFRRKLLDAGVELFEFREDSTINPPNGDAYSSLHSKYIVFDDDVVFIGSMNLDPRSLYINTELGIVLRSRALARQFTDDFERLTNPDNAWRVYDTPEGLRWTSSRGVLEQQPARSDWQRTRAALYSLLPLAGQL